jgi:hypothetical protein
LRAVRDKGLQWLAETKTDDDPQSIAMRLVLWQRLGRPAAESEALIQSIKDRQNADGGWGQTKEMPSGRLARHFMLWPMQE